MIFYPQCLSNAKFLKDMIASKEKYKEETTKSLATTVAYKAIGNETTKLNENQNLS